jgi:hypothetical protein
METRDTIPADLEEVRLQFESWRGTHTRRSPIPEALWASAVKLAREQGLEESIPDVGVLTPRNLHVSACIRE